MGNTFFEAALFSALISEVRRLPRNRLAFLFQKAPVHMGLVHPKRQEGQAEPEAEEQQLHILKARGWEGFMGLGFGSGRG